MSLVNCSRYIIGLGIQGKREQVKDRNFETIMKGDLRVKSTTAEEQRKVLTKGYRFCRYRAC